MSKDEEKIARELCARPDMELWGDIGAFLYLNGGSVSNAAQHCVLSRLQGALAFRVAMLYTTHFWLWRISSGFAPGRLPPSKLIPHFMRACRRAGKGL